MRAVQIRAKPALIDGRRSKRTGVSFDASIREPGCSKFNVRILDLSEAGFRCTTSFTLIPDSTVWLTIPGLAPLEARVAWRDTHRYGFAFLHPLHVAVFDHICRHVKSPE